MDWCERQLGGEGPEFFNSITSHAITVAGISVLIDYKLTLLLPALLLMLIGTGSAMFHYDPRYRMADELPIVLLLLWFIRRTSNSANFPLLTGVLLTSTWFNTKGNCVVLIGTCLYCHRTTSVVGFSYMSTATLFLALSLWALDIAYCSVHFPYFHALWHVVIAVSARSGMHDMWNFIEKSRWT